VFSRRRDDPESTWAGDIKIALLIHFDPVNRVFSRRTLKTKRATIDFLHIVAAVILLGAAYLLLFTASLVRACQG
jgi:hypothetical protein